MNIRVFGWSILLMQFLLFAYNPNIFNGFLFYYTAGLVALREVGISKWATRILAKSSPPAHIICICVWPLVIMHYKKDVVKAETDLEDLETIDLMIHTNITVDYVRKELKKAQQYSEDSGNVKFLSGLLSKTERATSNPTALKAAKCNPNFATDYF